MKKLIRVALALIVALILFGSSSISAKANSDAIDLELGDEGATSWQIANICPGQSGTKTVTLHNAGYSNGVVTIWISDIKETDFAGDGAWLDDYVLFGISCDKLSTNLSLPVTIQGLPQDASGKPNYLRIKPLNRGETITLIWHWQFLSEAGNEAQGDSFSFTINYLLEGIPTPPASSGDYWEEPAGKTYLSGKINWKGVMTRTVIAKSFDKRLQLIIEEGTKALTRYNRPLSWIGMYKMKNPPEPPEDANVISLFYDFKPAGATFEPSATLEYHYKISEIPEGISEKDLVIVYWDADANEWVKLKCIVDTETQTITAKLAHFTTFVVFGYEVVIPPVISPPPEPVSPEPVPPELTPPEPEPPAPPEPAEPTPEPPAVVEPTEPIPESVEEFNLPLWQITGALVGLGIVIYLVIRRRRA